MRKGPGRRPQSAKRQRFTELRGRGWSVVAAAREVGVSRTTGNNWSRGYKTYRHGEVAGFVPALDRLAVRQISARLCRRTSGSRSLICTRLVWVSVRSLSGWAGRRRRSRGSWGATPPRGVTGRSRRTGGRPRARRARHHPRRIEANAELGQLVAELLAQRWSPQQISRHLKRRFPGQPGMHLCPESIYQAVYQPGSLLLRPSPLAAHRRSPLRTGRDHRRAHQH